MNTFLENKYTKWYKNIIANAKLRDLKKNEYVENHHIIPSCIGGENSSDNKVKLTAKEHFVCHHLLVHMTTGKIKSKMSFAMVMFTRKNSNHKRYQINARTYDHIRRLVKEASIDLNKGRKQSEETKAKMRLAWKTRKPITDITRAKLSLARSKIITTDATKLKMSEAHRGKKFSDQHKQKISLIKQKQYVGKGNPRALIWKVENENGNILQFKSLKTWCFEQNIPVSSLMCTIKTKKFSHGFRIVEKLSKGLS